MRIYTKTGDAGETGLFNGKRVLKTEAVVEALGAIDELNASIGVVIAQVQSQKLKGSLSAKDLTNDKSASKKPKVILKIYEKLESVQGELMNIGSVIGGFTAGDLDKLLAGRTKRLEEEIDEMTEEMLELRNFILPGGSEIAASCI